MSYSELKLHLRTGRGIPDALAFAMGFGHGVIDEFLGQPQYLLNGALIGIPVALTASRGIYARFADSKEKAEPRGQQAFSALEGMMQGAGLGVAESGAGYAAGTGITKLVKALAQYATP